MIKKVKIVAMAGIVIANIPGIDAKTVDYARAEQMLPWNAAKHIANDLVEPRWIGESPSFWYRNNEAGGHIFKYYDIDSNTISPLFDHTRLAVALGKVTGKDYIANNLPFETLALENNKRAIAVKVGNTRYRCAIDTYGCNKAAVDPGGSGEGLAQFDTHVLSPDGRWEAFVKNHNVFIRSTKNGDIRQLTNDGIEFFGYGVRFDMIGRFRKEKNLLIWSPDSKKIVVQRYDARNVEQFHIVLSTDIRPRHYAFPYALPGDKNIPEPHIFVLDIKTGKSTELNLPENVAFTIIDCANNAGCAWGNDPDLFYFFSATREFKQAQLHEANIKTGNTRALITEHSQTYVGLVSPYSGTAPMPWRIGDDSIFWLSERDNWAHIYQYDRNGNLVARLTKGEWPVANIVKVDEKAGHILFTARGRENKFEPWFEALYKLDLKSKTIRLLTPEAATHKTHLSPDGKYFTDTYSRVDLPPVTILRDIEGRLVRLLEHAGTSALLAAGWRAPQAFRVNARDGKTLLKGVMYKPSDFDPNKKYPLIDAIYPGPSLLITPQGFELRWEQALAELGFIVINLNAMGTWYHSKSFRETAYGNFADLALPDHVAALDQLAERHGYIDRDRVGMVGISAGGYASANAILRYPDVYKVAVAIAGNHDNRSYNYYFGERFNNLSEYNSTQGKSREFYQSQANYRLAGNLKGKLLLMHGTADDNVHPALTLRLVDALVKENKDFDMYLLPEFPHVIILNAFVMRKTWDYFVRNLLGGEPPKEYVIKTPSRFPGAVSRTID